MRVDLAVLTVVALSLGLGCRKEAAQQPVPTPVAIASTNSGLIARLHFSGSEQVLAATNAEARLKAIAALPETAALEEDALAKLATAPYRFLQSKQRLPAGAVDQAALIRPLLDDLIHHESYVELRNLTNPVPELLLAVRLGNDRAELWRTNLAAVLTAWTGLPTNAIQVDGFVGWELKKHDLPNLVRFIRSGDWVLFGWGQDGILGQAGAIQRIKAQGRPVEPARDHWLDGWVDLPALLAHQSVVTPASLPKMQLKLGWTGEDVKSEAVLQFPESLNLSLSQWKVPFNLIHDPLIGFAAVRGVAPWLKQARIASDLKIDPLPDQVYAWAVHGVPFQTYLAAPIVQGTNFLEQLGSQLISLENSNVESHHLGQLSWNDAHTNLIWKGLPPVISPSLSASAGTNGDFILLSLFPSPPLQQVPPPELFRELTDHTNLVYYDWEITAEHIGQWRNLIAFYNLAGHKPMSSPQAPAQKWIDALTKKLGNSVTEVTISAPNELSLLRNSFVGLTSFELVFLARWEEAPGFPLDAHFPQPQWPPLKTAQRPQTQTSNALPPATTNPPTKPEPK